MRRHTVIGVFLLLSAFSVLTTCQLQLNQSKGLSLRVVNVPKSISSGARSVAASSPAGAKDITGPSGATVVVTILTGTGAPWASSEPISTNGKTSVDFAVPLPPPGAYQTSAILQDASGNLLSQVGPTSFSVPSQTNPIVLTMPSNLLTAVVTDASSGTVLSMSPAFSPVVYSGYIVFLGGNANLTLTTVDPSATITVLHNGPISPTSPSVYPIPNDGFTTNVTVTAPDGSTVTYTFDLTAG